MAKFIPGFGPNTVNLGRNGGVKRARFIPTDKSVAVMTGGNFAPAPIIPGTMVKSGPLGGPSVRELDAKDAIFQTVYVPNPPQAANT
jgi:hypothetical protein